MLQNYAEKPSENWRSKDAAIYLVTSSASKAQTQKHGVTQSSELVPLPQFAGQHIETELAKASGTTCLIYACSKEQIFVYLNFDIYLRK